MLNCRGRRVPDKKPSVADIDTAPENLPVPVREPPVPAVPDEFQEKFSEVANENFDLKADNKALRDQLDSKKAIEDLLGPTARRAFIFLCCYGFGALLLLLLNGFHVGGFTLSDTILGLIVGSTAVSAIGVFAAVIRGLFQAIKKS
jgi:hypothetical protein